MDVLNKIGITEIKDDTNFWMIRTKRGFFFDEYIKKQYIAIGWNLIKESTLKDGISNRQQEALKEEIKQVYDEKLPGTAVNKCIKFYSSVKVGDIAMIVDKHRVAFATIGEYYEENDEKLTIDREIEVNKATEDNKNRNHHFDCPYIKRRKITIIKVIKNEAEITPYLYKAMAVNRHSLSDLCDYAETILSYCYDSYIYNGKLTLAFKIRKKDDINALDLSNFISSASRIAANNQSNNVSVKTSLHSFGDVLLQIKDFADTNPLFTILIIYVAIFGGKVKDYEFGSLVSVIKWFVNRKHEVETQKLDEEIKKVQIQKTNAETAKLAAETALLEEELLTKKQNNEKQIKIIDECLPVLIESSKNMEVEPQSSTIINITEFLDEIEKQKGES